MPIKTFAGDNAHRALARGLDFACLAAAYATTTAIAAWLVRANMFIWPEPAPSDILGWPAQYIVLLLTALIAWSVVGSYVGVYRSDGDLGSTGNFGQLSEAALLWMAVIGVAIFLLKMPNVSRLFVLSFVSLGSMLIALRDSLERFLVRRTRQSQHRVAVVIGNGGQADWLIEYLRKNFCPQPYALVRALEPSDLTEPKTNGAQHPDSMIQTQRPRRSLEVFVAAADISGDACGLIPQLLKRGVETHIMPAVFDASIFRTAIGGIGGVPLITVRNGELSALEAMIKRAIDFAGSALLLALAAPLMVVLALLVKISSPGPVLFRQERLGKNGRRICVDKFRTMRWDAENILKSDAALYREYVENNYKLPKGKDPRITPLGRILRQLSLDELPQLITVLRGEMSLVGPRPIVPDEIEKYGDYASLLLSVQPGLTGQWQVSGRSEIADYARRVRLDMEYLRDQSIATDLRILMRTVPVVLLRQGAH
ncbi:MAG: sugar transferase [Candidatus Binataceae bacterium]